MDELCAVRVAIRKVLMFLKDKTDPYTMEELIEELNLDFYDYKTRSFRDQFPFAQKYKLKRAKIFVYGTSDVINKVKALDEFS